MGARILLADDHEIVLEGIRGLVEKSGRPWEVCGEARDGEEAVEMIKALQPDLAVLDITMPGMSGLQAARKVVKLGLGCRLLMFTMHESAHLAGEVRGSGAHGYVLKAQAARDLIRAIDCLLEGKTFYGAPAPEKEQEPGNPGILQCRAFAFA